MDVYTGSSIWQHYPSSDEIYHYGIKGQVWGRRRYQNPDGSLTEEGRRRYGVLSGTIERHNKKVVAKRQASENDEQDAKQKASSGRTKRVSEMSDDEITERIKRLTLERNLLNLEADVNRLQPAKVSTGQKIAKQLGQVAVDGLTNAAKQTVTAALNDAAKKAIENSREQNKSKETKEYEALKKEADTLKLQAQIKGYQDTINGVSNNKKKGKGGSANAEQIQEMSDRIDEIREKLGMD